MLWEEFDRSPNAVCLHLRHKVQISPVVVSQRPQIPGVCASRRPRSTYSQCFVDDDLATWRGKGVKIPIVRPIEGFVRQYCWVDSGSRSKFNASCTCGVNLSQSWSGNYLSVVARAAINAS